MAWENWNLAVTLEILKNWWGLSLTSFLCNSAHATRLRCGGWAEKTAHVLYMCSRPLFSSHLRETLRSANNIIGPVFSHLLHRHVKCFKGLAMGTYLIRNVSRVARSLHMGNAVCVLEAQWPIYQRTIFTLRHHDFCPSSSFFVIKQARRSWYAEENHSFFRSFWKYKVIVLTLSNNSVLLIAS